MIIWAKDKPKWPWLPWQGMDITDVPFTEQEK